MNYGKNVLKSFSKQMSWISEAEASDVKSSSKLWSARNDKTCVRKKYQCYKHYFNAELIRLVNQTKISLLLKIQCKHHHYLYTDVVDNG
jgi:hypothetical protein